MERVPPKSDTSVIHRVMLELPQGIKRRLGHVHFCINTDPDWVGMGDGYKYFSDGRTICGTSHISYGNKVCQPHMTRSSRYTTIFLYGEDVVDQKVILHELGHNLLNRLNHEGWRGPSILPLDSYAATCYDEAFATAFQSWATVEGEDMVYYHNREVLVREDKRTAEFFYMLAQN